MHSLEHYLEHPQVHTTLFRYLISLRGRKGPTRDEMSEALKVYRMNTIGAQVTDAWRDALDRLKQPSSESFASIFELWERYGALLK